MALYEQTIFSKPILNKNKSEFLDVDAEKALAENWLFEENLSEASKMLPITKPMFTMIRVTNARRITPSPNSKVISGKDLISDVSARARKSINFFVSGYLESPKLR